MTRQLPSGIKAFETLTKTNISELTLYMIVGSSSAPLLEGWLKLALNAKKRHDVRMTEKSLLNRPLLCIVIYMLWEGG